VRERRGMGLLLMDANIDVLVRCAIGAMNRINARSPSSVGGERQVGVRE
jgi:hypothetical protein